MKTNRRTFIKQTGIITAATTLAPSFLSSCSGNPFKISLAEWSLHRALRGGEMTNLDFPAKAKDFGIMGLEYVNTFFDSANESYLSELLKRTQDVGVENVLIMVDGEGALGDLDDDKRQQAVENHYKWVEAAKYLGCHSIRVNARGNGTEEEVANAAVHGLGALSEYAEKEDINVIVENHGGYSSNGKWMSDVIRKVANANCGTLPDFGNFCITRVMDPDTGERRCADEYDRYKGVEELMPFAYGVSAKSHEFDSEGNEIHTDFYKMIDIVKSSGYKGYIGIEYEGSKLSEDEGIIATKKLLEKIFAEL